MDIRAELSGRQSEQRGRTVRVACRAELDYLEEDGRSGSAHRDVSADLPVERGRAKGWVTVRFDLPFLQGPLRTAEVRRLDCRLW
ncbi:hypothetical protein [Mangrovicoccus ximenensis]|uniref:hypothetical protein n=1 Tax=Mangrovicoccus ximenensis TaxID=1911570 RepID=UPI000D335F81|nr:hypothetical protein [Mangrovicoccus ximenensis]